MEYLQGGRPDKIARSNNKVHRPAGPWSATVHQLLHHIRKQGFLDGPEPFGFDSEGNEVVSYIDGDVGHYPLPELAKSDEALVSSAQLLRRYHDASAFFANQLTGDEAWMLPIRRPIEVICHGDYAPYNVVLDGEKAIGIIDFDTAHPAPRVWDIAYALYRWAPLTHPDNQDGFGSPAEQIGRARLFCDAYRLPQSARAGVVDLVIERLRALVTFMQVEAEAGNEAFRANIDDGHHLLYLNDIENLEANKDVIQSGLFGVAASSID